MKAIKQSSSSQCFPNCFDQQGIFFKDKNKKVIHEKGNTYLKNIYTCVCVCVCVCVYTYIHTSLEKKTATHSSTLAWAIPWTEEPGGLQSMGSQRVGHD